MGFTDFLKSLSNFELAGVSLGVGILAYLLWDNFLSGIFGGGGSGPSRSSGARYSTMEPRIFKTPKGITKCQLACTDPVQIKRPERPPPYSPPAQPKGCFRLVSC